VSDGYGGALAPQHQEVLRSRAVPPDVALERGYVSVDGVAQLRRLGFQVGSPPLPALLIPRFTVDGERSAPQLRPDRPRVTTAGKERKYEAPVGAGNFLDVHPRCRAALADAAVPLVVSCEGTLKADALLAHLGSGACVVSIPGVTGWRGSVGDAGAKTTTALPDWHDVALRGRLVHLACDSDYTSNANVRRAVTALARYLESKGAGVRVVFPPPGPNDSKQGWDDYLAADGSWAGRLAEIQPGAGPKEETAKKRSQADELVALADDADLFHDGNGDAFARLIIGDHRELWPVKSRGFRRWLIAGFYAATGKAPNAEALGAALAVGVIGHRLYAAGGANARNGALTTLEIYDFRRRRWRHGPSMRVAREHLAGAVAHGRFYALAGRAAGQGNFAVVEAYDPARRRWLRMPSMRKPRGGIAAATVRGRIVVVGGEESAGTIREVELFDPRTRRWRRLADLPTPRHGLGVVAAPGKVYAIGGGPVPGLTVSDANEYLELA